MFVVFVHQYVAISSCLYRCLCVFVCVFVCQCTLMCLCTHAGIKSRVCQRGVVLSVHLSSLERSHSATPVAVRALCPPHRVALLPSLPLSRLPPLPPPSTSPPPHSCLLSCVHWPSAHSLEHVLFISQSEQQSHRHVNTQNAHKYCMHADTLKWVNAQNEVTRTHTHNQASHCPMYSMSTFVSWHIFSI